MTNGIWWDMMDNIEAWMGGVVVVVKLSISRETRQYIPIIVVMLPFFFRVCVLVWVDFIPILHASLALGQSCEEKGKCVITSLRML